MNLEEMTEIRAGQYETIDFKETLSPEGKKYFKEGLSSWKKNIEHNIAFKTENLSEIEIEKIRDAEREAVYELGLEHDFDLGPISLIHSEMQLTYINRTLDYLNRYETFSDELLYKYLDAPNLLFRQLVEKLESECSAKPIEDSDDEELENFAKKVEENTTIEQRLNNTLSETPLKEVFHLFRISQFDMLNESEKDLFIGTFRSGYSVSLFRNYDFKETALNSMTDEKAEERDSSVLYMHPEEAFGLFAGAFLKLHDNFTNHYADQNNVNSFYSGYRVLHSFEMMQMVYHASLMNYEELGDFFESDYEEFQCHVSFNMYEDYYKSKKEPRFKLLDPDEIEGDGDVFIEFDDFTSSFYNTEMTHEGRISYDRLLQENLDEIAHKLNLPSVNVQEYRKTIPEFSQPNI